QTEYQKGQLFSYSEPFPNVEIEPVRLEKGRYPLAGHNEVAIEQRMAEAHRFQLGDTLVVQNHRGQDRHLKIVGFFFQPYIYFGSEGADTSVYTDYQDAQDLLGFNGYSSLYVRFASFGEALQQSSRFRGAVTSETAYKIVFYLLDNPQENAFIVGIHRFSRVMLILAVVAMVVASFLVTNVITTIVAEQQRQIGAMKAIGATRRDIYAMYLGIAFMYGLMGTIPGVMLGIPLGRRAAEATAPLANTILQDTSPPLIPILLGIGMGLFIPVLAAIMPVYNGSKITIVKAMTDRGLELKYGKGVVPRLMRQVEAPMSIDQAVNNISRRKGRFSLTVFSLALASAAFMGMFAVFYVLTSVIVDIRETLNVNVSVSVTNADLQVLDVVQGLLSEQREQILTVEPGVAVELQVEPAAPPADETENGEITQENSDSIFVTGITAESDLSNLTLVEGTLWEGGHLNGNTIVITPAMADRLAKGVGDPLQLHVLEKTGEFQIIGIAEFPIELAFMELQTLRNFVGVVRDAPVPNNYWDTVQIESEQETLKERDIWVVGIDERAGRLLSPEFSAEQPGVILGQKVAELGGYEVRDSIVLKTEEESETYPVLAIAEVDSTQLMMFGTSVPDEVRQSQEIIAMYWEELARLEALDYRTVSPTTYYIDLTDPQSPEEAAPSALAPVHAYKNQVAFADRITQTILSIGLVMNLASLLMAFVGGIGLLTITSISVFERQREIGVMRSVGATSKNIMNLFIVEGMLVGLVAWIIAVPLSYVLSQLLINAVPFREVIQFEYTPIAPIIGMMGTFLVTLIATLYPSIRAARKTVSDILRYQ
ncbi:MAG: ABC transporter permease, partial [Anaerolineae bacterium]|nr:ABC transporter permease [Anaerolineae bacterium]